jgi:UDP-N-acetylglucosamine 4,6-dehydratase (inverting)
MFKGKSLLITGGTGSFGKALLKKLIDANVKLRRLIIFSRDELKQFELEKVYSVKKYPFLRYFLGDVRDLQRLQYAFKDVDYVVHAAALKQVPAAEYNPFEFIKTNVLGAHNIIEAALSSNVKKVLALSTDKAVSPSNLYGATKLCSDKLFIAANNIFGNKNLSFSVVRYGNVFGSRGSVLHEFLRQEKMKAFEITDKRMTRFNIDLEIAVNMVLWVLKNSIGAEIFIPKLPSLRIIDLAKAINPNCKIIFTGMRPGEKLHEELITNNDNINVLDIKKYYIIMDSNISRRKFLTKKFNGKKVSSNFCYNSEDNNYYLNLVEIKKLINRYRGEWN